MRLARGLLALVLLGGTGCFYGPRVAYVEPQVVPARRPLSREDVRTLVRAGVGDEIILARLRTEGVTARPTAEEVVDLKKDGASDKVIEALLGAPVTTAAPARVVHPAYPGPPYGYPYPYPPWEWDPFFPYYAGDRYYYRYWP